MDMKHKATKEKRFFKPQKGSKSNEKYKNFIGSRSEGQGFADKRKRKIKYEYMKMLKKEKQKAGRQKQTSASNEQQSNTETDNARKKNQQVSDIGFPSGNVSRHDLAGSSGEHSKARNKRQGNRDGESVEEEGKSDLYSTKKFAGSSKNKQFKQFRGDNHVKVGVNRFSKAAEEHRQRKEKKLLKKQEFLERKKYREEAMLTYQKKKQDTFKKICKKTHKGQPVMKNQIEYLLQKIEKQVNQR